jgi:hypothetical protein
MNITKLFISEPWDFVNPITKDNSIIIKYEKQATYMSKNVDIVSLLHPFEYTGKYIDMLILVPRYSNYTYVKTYNILSFDKQISEITEENTTFLFIGSLE